MRQAVGGNEGLVLRRPFVALIAVALLAAPAQGAPASLSSLDVISLEIAYTTVLARYYKPVQPATLLAGARNGMVAYLRSRGIASPAIPAAPPRADRWRAESEIDRDVALAIARYGKRIRTADLVDGTIAGELAALHDPYTVLFRPAAMKTFVGFLDGAKLGGIGAELDVDRAARGVRVVDVFPGSPAAAAGLASGDRIVAIDGRAPDTASAEAVGAQLRGKPGTTVRVSYARDGERREAAIVRRAIAAPDVLARRLPGDVAYVRIRSFGAQAAAQFDAALERLREPAPRGYVLDLRGNGGGYRDAAIAIASHAVGGTIVTTQERNAPAQRFAAKPASKLDAPLAVLVDGDTASAAEIVAGAIQDARAGTLIGTKTFGKGLVQEVFPMPGGAAIKVTTAAYRTPSGRDIEGRGLAPDVVVDEPRDASRGVPGSDPQLDRALTIIVAESEPSTRRSAAPGKDEQR